jgi:N-acyl amino acid synthase of PEP-CTERM/exosortase system
MTGNHFKYQAVDGGDNLDTTLKSIFQLRYQVYVNEWGFEKPEDHHPDGLEMDEYDAHSRHIYACSHNSDQVIGTARIILGSTSPFPIERHFDISSFPVANRRGQVAEISRLAISKNFRRRAIDKTIFGDGEITLEDASVIPFEPQKVERERRKCEHELILGIYLLIYSESIKLGLTHWYAVMARGLHVILGRWGIPFEQIGPEKEYHGIRAPYAVSIADLERNLEKKNPQLIALARKGV